MKKLLFLPLLLLLPWSVWAAGTGGSGASGTSQTVSGTVAVSGDAEVYGETLTATVTYDGDADLTDEVDLEDYALATLLVPATFDGTEIKVHCAEDTGGTFVEIKASDDSACTVTTAASQAAPLVPSGDCAIAFAGCRYFKIETVTDQTTTDTVFKIAVKR